MSDQTIREHADAIDDLTWGGDERHMPEIRVHAQAILDTLNNTTGYWSPWTKQRYRIIDDPERLVADPDTTP